MARKVIISIKARIEIEKTVDWMVRNWSPRTASSWHNGLSKTIQMIANDPGRYPFCEEDTSLNIQLREKLYRRKRTTYRILYTYDDEVVRIIYIRNASQGSIEDV